MFITEAARRELGSQRHEELPRSLQSPHSKNTDLAEQDLEEWSRTLPEEDAGALLESGTGKTISWVPGQGWTDFPA